MTDRRWNEVWKLYRELRSLPENGRSVRLRDMPADVREEVLGLLEQSDAVTQMSGPEPAMAGPEPGYAPGTELGKYVVTGIVGEGGFGRVYSAHDRDLRRSVAIKILSAQRAELNKHLIEEARSASALNHPNILTIHETIEIGGHPAMVMEFVQGRSLRKELAEAAGPLRRESAIALASQIAQALAAAHAVGIVHRDVKPENILVRPDGYVKLVDFGLAAPEAPDRSGEARWQPFEGTLRYTSPEQLKGAPSSAASDIFSLGLVLYELVTGVHPFRRETPLATAEAIARVNPEPPARLVPSLPASLDRLILRMLAKDAAQRPAARQVVEALEQGTGRGGGRERSNAALVALVAAAAAAGLIAIKWGPTLTDHTAAPTGLRLKTTPLTGNPGRERRPAISSDGKFVVFEWQENVNTPERTVVREIGTDRTTVLPINGSFTWVPGTHRIAFRRRDARGVTLYTISRYGDDEQPVFTIPNLNFWSFSPDGKYVAYTAPTKTTTALFRYTIATREHKQLTDPPMPGEQLIEVSHDGRQIAVRRGFGDVYITTFPEPAEWRKVVSNQTEGEAVTWLRGGSALVTSGFLGSNNSLWLHPLASPAAAIRLTSVGVEAFQGTTAADINRMVWLHAVDDTNIWRMPATGGAAVRVAASLFRDSDVTISSTGAMAFRSDRSGYPEIWVADANGENQRRMTSLEGFTGSPRWSADGRRLAFDSRLPKGNGDIWVTDCGGGAAPDCQKPVRVTDHAEADVLPNWSRDGRFVYFASRRSGAWQLWRTALNEPSAPPVQLTRDGGYFAMESADGQWLYYSRLEPPEVSGIWRRPLQPGPLPFDHPGELVLPLARSSTATWNLCGDEIFYQTFYHRSLSPQAQTEIAAFHLKSKRTRKIQPDGTTQISRGLAVSADCQSVYFSRLDRSESNVVWADYEVIY